MFQLPASARTTAPAMEIAPFSTSVSVKMDFMVLTAHLVNIKVVYCTVYKITYQKVNLSLLVVYRICCFYYNTVHHFLTNII